MDSLTEIKGVLLDSGGTLVRPIGGAWFPGTHFRRILLENGVHHFAWKRLDEALQKGMDYLDAHHHVLTEDGECDQFGDYYGILLSELGLSGSASELPAKLAQAMVYQPNFHPYLETRGILNGLQKRGLRLGILSDSWPSLDRKFRELGIRGFFHAFVISSQIGCYKPDERNFRIAIERMDLSPEEMIFVDDWPDCVEKATEMGMVGVWLDRGVDRGASNSLRVESLEELLEMLEPRTVRGS